MELAGYDLLIGFDTEYVSEDASAQAGDVLAFDPEKFISRGNRVLCISYALYSPSTGQRFSGMVPIPPTRRRRWTLKQFIEQVLDAAVDAGMISSERMRAADDRHPKKIRENLRIILCGHFTRADLPGFADFKKLKRAFSAVRKTYTSIMAPHVFTARPGPYRAVVSITLRDTRLLTPAGYGSLAAIGKMLGLEKLIVPDVRDEAGALVPGIARMDLVQAMHPDEFEIYARRDAEVALTYLIKVHELACEMGVPGIPATIGSLAVNMFCDQCSDFASFMGRVPDPDHKNRLMIHPAIAEAQGFWANGFHGGRNQAFGHGIFESSPDCQWYDIDLASAYTFAMAAIPTIDWNVDSRPRRIEDIATTSAATVARVKFRFPEGTRFPCLPVRVGTGLVFPLEGETTTAGIEIMAAIAMGAEIEVLGAHRFEFAAGAHEYAAFTQRIAALRARFKTSNPLFEKLVKEAGNSLYGKCAQAVAAMRTINPEKALHFDTVTGKRIELPASGITNPVHATLITATIRAVLAEILSRLPPDRTVLSVTTDGFLANCTLEEALAATSGPICTFFKKALESVAPGKSLLEVKHRASAVAVARTRGAFTVEAPEGYTGPPILARAGHKLESSPDDPWSEVAEFNRIFRERTADSKLAGRDFISVEDQWMADADLVTLPVSRRVNLDYDMGCRPVQVEEAHGLLRFVTEPWRCVRAYKTARDAHAALRASGGQLKGIADWRKIEAEINAAAGSNLTAADEACLRWMRVMAAVQLCGKGKGMTLVEGAAAISELGLPTTQQQMKDAGKNARTPVRKGARVGARRPRRIRALLKQPRAMPEFLRKLERHSDQTSISKQGVAVLERAKALCFGAQNLSQVRGCCSEYRGYEPTPCRVTPNTRTARAQSVAGATPTHNPLKQEEPDDGQH
jgi:hypothetical protein